MATFVLVPGGWLGGWAWQRVATGLRAAGHIVYPVTLTGLGERRHVPCEGLDTHIEDVAGLLRFEDLRDVVLVGHSYGGAVATAVAEAEPSRIGELIYYDALVPLSGETPADCVRATGPVGEAMCDAIDADAARRGDGRFGFVPPVDYWGLGDDLEWVRQRVVPHPYPPQNQPIERSDQGASIPRRYIMLMEFMQPMAERAAADGAQVAELLETPRGPVGHYGMLTAPAETTALLAALGSS